MALGGLIRDLRLSHGLSQGDLASQLCAASGRPRLTREEVSRWERGKVIPGPFWIDELATVLNVPAGVLREEARLDRVNRRSFISLAALTVAHGKLTRQMVATVAANDPGPLTTAQTSHGTDLVIAALADTEARRRLDAWITGADNPVLRVNAAGILAKLPGQGAAERVGDVLDDDPEVSQLYRTAVLSRVCAWDWHPAERTIADNGLRGLPRSKAAFVAGRLAEEVLNPRDAGARWCSAVMLRELVPSLGV